MIRARGDALRRAGDVVVLPGAVYHTHLLPGTDARPEELLVPAEDA